MAKGSREFLEVKVPLPERVSKKEEMRNIIRERKQEDVNGT